MTSIEEKREKKPNRCHLAKSNHQLKRQCRAQNFSVKKLLFRILYSENLPNFTCYAICIFLFHHFITILIQRYLEYKTNVLIQYDIPRQVKFPAFTICSCSSFATVCDKKHDDMISNEFALYRSMSALELLENRSISESSVMISCYYVLDSRRPQYRKNCSAVESVVHSLHDGRKCFSYLTILSDNVREKARTPWRSPSDLAEQYGNVSYIYMEVNFTEAAIKLKQFQDSKHNKKPIFEAEFKDEPDEEKEAPLPPLPQRQQQSPIDEEAAVQWQSIILSMHAAETIPTVQDVQFYAIQPGQFYQFHFGKRVTELMPSPYITNCREYHELKRPRTQNECFHMCLIGESYQRFGCISSNAIVTNGWIKQLIAEGVIDIEAEHLQLCDREGKTFFVEYIAIRRRCVRRCIQRDCRSEFYYLSYESAPLKSALATNITNFNYSIITIFPDMNRYEKVKHTEDLSVFEVIGAIGGHAHIWLGLSAIQIYDIVWRAGRKLRFFWDKWSRSVAIRARGEQEAADSSGRDGKRRRRFGCH